MQAEMQNLITLMCYITIHKNLCIPNISPNDK
jgi:hypothetical protein